MTAPQAAMPPAMNDLHTAHEFHTCGCVESTHPRVVDMVCGDAWILRVRRRLEERIVTKGTVSPQAGDNRH